MVPLKEYGVAAAAAALCTAACFAAFPFLQPANLVMVYILGAVLVAARGRWGPAAVFSALGVLCFDFFFVPPRFSLAVSDARYIPTFFMMFLVGAAIALVMARIRSQAEAAMFGETRTAAMHALSLDLAAARGVDAILEAALRHAARVLDAEASALLPGEGGLLEVRLGPEGKGALDAKEKGVARWVLDAGRSAGWGTQTLPVAPALYVPLVGAAGPVGVLRLKARAPGRPPAADQMLLLESFAHQIGLALEVDRLQEDARKASLEAEKERMRSSLLSSVSHDLRTPLAAIVGSASSLVQSWGKLSGGKGRELAENIQSEGERMARLVHNLIQTTRLESGAAPLRKEPGSIEEIAGSALERLEKLLQGRRVEARLPEDLPLVPMDAVLMEQVFVNLIDNAARHTPQGSPIDVSAWSDARSLTVEIADRGPGLAPEELERVFEKFYHAKSPAAGAGLGLAICRAVVGAHGGRIWAENRPGGGASFRFTLSRGEAGA